MTTSLNTAVLDLARQNPEWQPWLTVIEEVLREAIDVKWEALVPARPESPGRKVPLLAGATLVLEAMAIARWSQQLMRTTYRSGAPNMSTLNKIDQKRLNSVELFKAALCQNGKRLKEFAIDLSVDADAFQAVALLVAVPFLHACNRRWALSIAENWSEGYCPVCGAWPAFAEVRGIERSRYLRCGRCGGAWQSQCLVCSYCGMTDHEELVSLVPEKSAANAVIDACKRCLGYVKTFTTLQGSPPAKVMLDDLASVDLDIAALQHGYSRPEGAGCFLDVTVTENGAGRGRFA